MAPDNRIAVCPGSYDPITNGHIDVISRASGDVRRADRRGRERLRAQEQGRCSPPRSACASSSTRRRISATCAVDTFDVLIVDYARQSGAKAIVKGLRAISDFEYELEMNQLNRHLASDVETRLPDGLAAVQFPVLERSQGDRHVRRRRLRSRARARSRGAVAGSHRPPTKSGAPMDVLVLIDKLDDLVHNAKAVPLTGLRARGPGGDLRHPRPDARDDPRGDQAGALDRQGAPGDAGGGQARGRADRQGGARAPDAARRRSRRSPSRPSARRRTSSRTPAPASARSASAPRTTPTRSSTRSRSTSRSSSPPSSAAASACRARTNRPKSASQVRFIRPG